MAVSFDGYLTVPIQRLLGEAAFDPDDIGRMTAAYDAALKLLQLNDRDDTLCGLVAAKIIQVFSQGEHDPPRLCARAMKELGIPTPD